MSTSSTGDVSELARVDADLERLWSLFPDPYSDEPLSSPEAQDTLWSKIAALQERRAELIAIRDAPMIQESLRAGRSFGWFGGGAPTRESVVWGRPRQASPLTWRKAPQGVRRITPVRVGRRVRVASSPRRSRAPGRLADDPEPEPVAVPEPVR